MRFKLKLRSILGDLLAKYPEGGAKGKIISRKLIKNVLVDSSLVQNLSQPVSSFVRVLARDEKNADDIIDVISAHKTDLGIKSLHKIDKPIDFTHREQRDIQLSHSIIIERDLERFLNSTIASTSDSCLAELRDNVLDGDNINNVLIDFSSPNIAKPFHYAHLRSTLIGNYLANLHAFLGLKVTRLNFVGDWGVQFGLLSLGLEQSSLKIDSFDQPIKRLVEIYIEANERAKVDPSYFETAKSILNEMETNPDSARINQWRHIKDLSMEELKRSYNELGIHFDLYEFESEYLSEAQSLVDRMIASGLTCRTQDGAVNAKIEKNYRPIEVPIRKSDGSTLYLSRDVAAALSRRRRLNFSRSLYVAGAEQEKHFHALQEVIKALGLDWSSELVHVIVGRVVGMSSRSGNFVLLSELIERATQSHKQATKTIPTSKVSGDPSELDEVARQLALSSLFLHELRHPRACSYKFSLESQARDPSGLELQAAHARVCSLLKRAEASGLRPLEWAHEVRLSGVHCVEVVGLLVRMAEFESSLHRSFWLLDASPLVSHAAELSSALNRARQCERLRVLGEPDELKARSRLTVFEAARRQLGLSLELLGLKALERV